MFEVYICIADYEINKCICMHSPDIDLLDILLLLCSGHAFVGPVTRGWTISLTLALSFSWKEISSKGTVIFHKALGPQQIIIFKNKLIS